MTNLEYYKEELKRVTPVEHIHNTFLCYLTKFINEHNGNVDTKDSVIDWLCEERKEPIKLKQWEYDLLNFYNENSPFYTFNCAMFMQKKGYFKGIDKTMKLKEILDNCEVEDVNS